MPVNERTPIYPQPVCVSMNVCTQYGVWGVCNVIDFEETNRRMVEMMRGQRVRNYGSCEQNITSIVDMKNKRTKSERSSVLSSLGSFLVPNSSSFK